MVVILEWKWDDAFGSGIQAVGRIYDGRRGQEPVLVGFLAGCCQDGNKIDNTEVRGPWQGFKGLFHDKGVSGNEAVLFVTRVGTPARLLELSESLDWVSRLNYLFLGTESRIRALGISLRYKLTCLFVRCVHRELKPAFLIK